MPRQTTTRERLITTAAELFWRQGYAQTGVNEIIQQAGATSGSFYHFFPAKEDLVLAVVDHVEELFESEIFGPARLRTDDPIEQVLAILDIYRGNLRDSNFGLGSPMGALAAEMSDSYPRVRLRIAKLFASWSGRVEALLEEAGPRLPKGLDRAALASTVLSTMEGAVLQARVDQSVAPLDAAIDQLRSYLLLLEERDHTTEPLPGPSRPLPKQSSPPADWKAW